MSLQTCLEPPLKLQGIKLKIISFIQDHIPPFDLWIEPFVGSGSVLFNIAPKKAIVGDNNPYIIDFYKSIINGEITPHQIKLFLREQSELLEKKGKEHFICIRDRFHQYKEPLDFLFWNLTSFGRAIVFSKKGKPLTAFGGNRHCSDKMILRIVESCRRIKKLGKKWAWIYGDFEDTIKSGLMLRAYNPLIYCDPPYIIPNDTRYGKYPTYFTTWYSRDYIRMRRLLYESGVNFVVSDWYEYNGRVNPYLDIWTGCIFRTYPLHRTMCGKRIEYKECLIIRMI